MRNKLNRAGAALVLLCPLLLHVRQATAQECRDATSQEKAVVEKMIRAVQENVETGLQKAGWKTNDERSCLPNPQIANHPGPVRPLMVCMRPLDMKFAPDASGGWGKVWQDSVQYYQAQGTPEGMKNMFRLLSAGELEIWVSENDPYLNIRVSPVDIVTRPVIPGASLTVVSTTKPDPQWGYSKVSAVLYFGNWANAKVTSGNDAYSVPYPFKHPAGTPFIVTFAVHIEGSPEACARVLKGIDWQKIGEGLTP